MTNTQAIKFTKMHGIGNDYIYINCLADNLHCDFPKLSRLMSDRHTGVGGDGIILICPSETADFKMRIFNADGSEAQMCGNGSRCVGKYVYDSGLTHKKRITLETLAGIKVLDLHTGDDGLVEEVTVDMGTPEHLGNPTLETKTDGSLPVTAISMGNPHGVVFVKSLADVDFFSSGPALERHPWWPEGANIEFAVVESADSIRVRVWERGSGETMACGTGACAVAVAAMMQGKVEDEVTIHLRGGSLKIRVGSDGHVYMRGPAATVFEGTYNIVSDSENANNR